MQRKNCGAGASCHRIAKSKFVRTVSGRRPKVRSSVIVRNVMEYLGASTAGMLCSQICREGPDIM